MKLAAYIGTRSGIAGLGNILIRLRLRGRYSHSEVLFEPGDGVDHLMPDGTCEPDSRGRLWCYSSVGLEKMPPWSPKRAGKRGGGRFKRIYVRNTKKWELCETRRSPSLAAQMAHERQGTHYDWFFIGSFISWLFKQVANKTACSEECALLLGFPDPHRFDPCSLVAAMKGNQ